jgi:hypothetical protein
VISPTLNTRSGATRMWALRAHGWSGWLITAHGSEAVTISFIHQYATPVTRVAVVVSHTDQRSNGLIVMAGLPAA